MNVVVDTSKERIELLKGVTDCILLSVIERKGPIYGYEIVRDVLRDSSGYFRLKEGTLYPVLKRLEKDELLTSRWENGRNRPRKYYSITPKGREALEEKHIQWQQFSTSVTLVYGSTSLWLEIAANV